MAVDLQVCIYREMGHVELDTLVLAKHVRLHGFVVFQTMQPRQTDLAEEVSDILFNSAIWAAIGETDSPHRCACVVDASRYDLRFIMAAAAQSDQESWEAGFGQGRWDEHLASLSAMLKATH